MKIAYFDCFSGASGDMIIGALLDAGMPFPALQKSLKKLHLKPTIKIRRSKTERCGLMGTGFSLAAADKHLSYNQMTSIIKRSALSSRIKSDSLKIMARLMAAEKRVHHGSHKGIIEFAELGSIDTIVDITGAVSGMESLGIDKIYLSPLPLSGGTIKNHHGIYPVPGPAAMELLKGFEVFRSPLQSELVTPTGAAILTTLGRPAERMPNMKIERAGYGAGTTEIPNQPNMLRVLIGEAAPKTDSDTAWVLETNIDNATGQVIGYLMERLLAAGALDAVAIPVQMKKSRPGTLVQVLCDPDNVNRMERIIFAETPTLGIRRYQVQRTKLYREAGSIKTPYGPIRCKVGSLDGKPAGSPALMRGKPTLLVPEYEDCRKAAQKHKVPLRAILSIFQ
ncbi:MAG: nickel pincer cofactor biosynthesis protein LarC [Candidatus Brocadiia bacterium]